MAMRLTKTDTGIAVDRDKWHSGKYGDFYLFDEIRNFADARVAEFNSQSDFAYFGDLESPPWASIGFAGRTRDSDALETSNHEVIKDALLEARPDSFAIEGYSHWAVGWIDVMRVDTSDDLAVAAVMSWHDALENYPVADEEHYSQTEHDDDEDYYRFGGRDDAIEILEKNADEFPTLFDRDGDFLDIWESALNRAFHDAMANGDHTALPPDEYLLEAMEDAMNYIGADRTTA